MAWKITLPDGFVLGESDLTIADAERLETETGTSWRFIHPIRSAPHARACVKLAMERSGSPPADVDAHISGLKVDEVLAMFGTEDETLPSEYRDGIPQPAAGTTTDS